MSARPRRRGGPARRTPRPRPTSPRRGRCWWPAPAGADSLALLAATVFEAREPAWRVVGRDRRPRAAGRLRPTHAARVVAQMAALGVDETVSVRVERRRAPGQGPEAAAREARYAVLERGRRSASASAVVLLGHTLDDQAETVLLGLARGSRRPLAGRDAPRASTCYRRPLLDVTRAQTEAACRAEGIEPGGRPAQRRPAVHPVPGPAPGAAGARGRARARGGRGPGPDRRPAARGHRARSTSSPTRALRRLRGAGGARLPGARPRQPGRRAAPRVLRLAALRRRLPAAELFRGARAGGRRARSLVARGRVAASKQVRAARPRHGVPRAADLADVPPHRLWQADAMDAIARRGRPGQHPLHRGADPGPARRAGRPRSSRTTRARTCCSSACCAAP